MATAVMTTIMTTAVLPDHLTRERETGKASEESKSEGRRDRDSLIHDMHSDAQRHTLSSLYLLRGFCAQEATKRERERNARRVKEQEFAD